MNLKYKKILMWIVVTLIIVVYIVVQNTWIDVEEINISTNKLSSNTKGIKIVQISDTHLPNSDNFIDKIIHEAQQAKPDLILMTGDLIDKSADIDNSGLDRMCSRLSEIAPCYAVSGNHELINNYSKWLKILTLNKVKVIDNKTVIFKKDGNKVAIMGLEFGKSYDSSKFEKIQGINNMPRILLAHNPEVFDRIFSQDNKIEPDFVLCGHAHGGQIRIPFIDKGLYAPGQGIFPKYTSGKYNSETGGVMVVSRGLGNKRVPIRINNRVHIPIININN